MISLQIDGRRQETQELIRHTMIIGSCLLRIFNIAGDILGTGLENNLEVFKNVVLDAMEREFQHASYFGDAEAASLFLRDGLADPSVRHLQALLCEFLEGYGVFLQDCCADPSAECAKYSGLLQLGQQL